MRPGQPLFAYNFLFYRAFGLFNLWLSLLATLVGGFYPGLWLVEQAKRRGRLILKELPFISTLSP